MGVFAYEARDEDGKMAAGMITAAAMEEAGAMLCNRGLFVIRIAEHDDGTRVKHTSRWSFRRGVRRDRVAWFMSQLSIMVDTGIPLSTALESLARQSRADTFGVVLAEIHKAVQEGRPLSDAMREHPDVFPVTVTSLIRASEVSGTMSRMLNRSAGHLMNELQILRRVQGALIYPALMLLTSIGVSVFLLTVILPKFADIFASKGALLPMPTRVLMGLSAVFMAHWPWIAAGTAMLIVGGSLWIKTTAGRWQIDTVKVYTPGLRKVFNTMYQTRAFRTIGMLLEAGVPMLDAIRVAADVSSNVHYHEIWSRVDSQVQLGERLSGPLLKSPLIPESVSQMIDAGDKAGRLPLVFDRVAQFIETEYEQAVRNATQMIEPCLVLFMGGLIGFIAAALMLPLFQSGRIVAH